MVEMKANPMMRGTRTVVSLLLLAGLLVVQTGCVGAGAPPAVADSVGSSAVSGSVVTRVATLYDDGEIYGLAFGPKGRYLVSSSPNTLTLHVWDWRNERIVRTLHKITVALLTATPVLYSPKGRFIVACHGVDHWAERKGGRQDEVADVWDARTGSLIKRLVTRPWSGGGCDGMAFTPDGRRLVYVTGRGWFPGDTVSVYSTSTWKKLWGIRTEPFDPRTLAVSPDGKRIAVIGDVLTRDSSYAPAQLLIIDLARHKVLRKIARLFLTQPSRALDWSPDGKYVIAGVRNPRRPGDAAVRIVDVRTGAVVRRELAPRVTSPWALLYTLNGKYVVERGVSRAVEIWDGRHRHLLQTITGWPLTGALAISPDGRYLAVGGHGRIGVWKFK